MEEVDNQFFDRRETHDNGDNCSDNRQEIFSKVVRAGKRTYFFDVKATRGNDYYLTITESKKRFNRDGRFFYEKHKLFLYKEDFDKFGDGLAETIAKIQELREADGQTDDHGHQRSYNQSNDDFSSNEPEQAAEPESNYGDDQKRHSDSQFTEVSFEDLGTADND